MAIGARVAVVLPAGTYRDWLASSLEQHGFLVGPIGSRFEPGALSDTDIVLLDLDRDDPSDEGLRQCAELRLRAPELLIVFLAHQDDERDRVSAFRVGADDYLTRQCSGMLLGVRLAALTRRRDAFGGPRRNGKQAAIVLCGPLLIDSNDWTASWRDHRLDLSMTRLKILKRLAEVPGRVCTPRDLMAAAAIRVESNTLTAHIKAIRDEFKRSDGAFESIRNERSIGYRWVVSCSPPPTG